MCRQQDGQLATAHRLAAVWATSYRRCAQRQDAFVVNARAAPLQRREEADVVD